jgi:RNA polymerase sigma factor FliA
MTNLVEKHLGYAHAIAAEVLKKLPASVDRSEIKSAAELGLVQAAKAYDSSRAIPFTTFAYYRIRGAIYDDLRQACRASKFEEAANEYMVDYTSRDGPNTEDAGESEIRHIVSGVISSYVLSLESLPQSPADRSADLPIDGLLREEQQNLIRIAMECLPKRNRDVLEAYYFQDLSLDEIGRRMGLSKSWVSRIHAKSLNLMRKYLDPPQYKPASQLAFASTGSFPQHSRNLD